MDKLRSRLHKPLSIADLARLAAMSERTFMRRFRAATGMTPGEWITRARVDRARELLESSALPIDQVAMRTGLGTPATLRHHFHRKVGVSPAEYRKRFSQSTRRAAGERSLVTGG
jgi:AraC family transcriptional activator FtrA